MRIAVTGHRPERITNWQFVEHQLYLAYRDLKVDTVIQGMAAGVDLTAAKIAYRNNIPFWCARPWAGHQPRKADEVTYQKALQFAEKVVDVDPSENYPGAWVYQKRNEWMVDHAEVLIAVWDGSSGGTYNCVKYSQKSTRKHVGPGTVESMPVWHIDPLKGAAQWL